MNIKRIVLYLILVGQLLYGCALSNTGQPSLPSENTDSIKNFDSVTLNTPGVMEISQGTSESLVMDGNQVIISSITAIVTDRTLVISSAKDLPSNSSIAYKLVVKNLSSVLLNGFSVVKIPAYTSDALELTVNGSGRMSLGDIKVTDLKLVIHGNGGMEADSITSTSLHVSSMDMGGITISGGNTKDLVLELGPGPFLGADFKSTNVKLNMTGSGKAQVWAVEKLDVTINGNGQVTYFGEPTMNMNISGGGQLNGGGNK